MSRSPNSTAAFDAALDAVVASAIAEVRQARSLVGDAVGRLVDSFHGLEKILATQSHALKEVTESLQTTGASGSRSFSDVVEKLVGEFVDEAVRVSRDSVKVIDKLVDLGKHVEGIVARSFEVERLARATRMLALNARIESARAGAHGASFAVVAGEVKDLAGASNALGVQIRNEVDLVRKSLANTVDIGKNLVSHDMMLAVETRKTMVEAVRRLDDLNASFDQSLHTISVNVSQAVSALQFDDMVGQILDSVVAKLESIGQLSKTAVREVAAAPAGGANDALVATTALLQGLVRQNGSRQSTLEKTDVELF